MLAYAYCSFNCQLNRSLLTGHYFEFFDRLLPPPLLRLVLVLLDDDEELVLEEMEEELFEDCLAGLPGPDAALRFLGISTSTRAKK